MRGLRLLPNRGFPSTSQRPISRVNCALLRPRLTRPLSALPNPQYWNYFNNPFIQAQASSRFCTSNACFSCRARSSRIASRLSARSIFMQTCYLQHRSLSGSSRLARDSRLTPYLIRISLVT